MIQTRTASKLALCLAGALIASRAGALSDTDFQGAMNYDFRPPGARSLAMGGAFTALSDDASGALNNPAGLTQLKRPEFTFSGKVWTNNFKLSWGRGSFGDFTAVDPSYPNQYFRESRDSYSTQAGPAFTSYAIPFRRVSLSFFAGQINRVHNSFLRDPIFLGLITLDQCLPTCIPQALLINQTAPTTAEVNIHHYRYGASLAVPMGSRFSAGFSVFQGKMDFRANTTRYVPGNTLSRVNTTLILDESSDSSAAGFSAGLLYRSDSWQAGLTYHRNEKFTARVRRSEGAATINSEFRPECLEVANAYYPGKRACEFNTGMRVPDRAALGVAWRLSPLLTLSGEAEFIRWSQMADGLMSFQGAEYDHEYSFDNALNPHLGAEYVILADTSPLSVRAGIWLEKGHLMKAKGDLPAQSFDVGSGYFIDIPAESRNNGQHALFPGSSSETHFSTGIGFVVGRLQFDAGYDYSRNSRQFELSSVFRF